MVLSKKETISDTIAAHSSVVGPRPSSPRREPRITFETSGGKMDSITNSFRRPNQPDLELGHPHPQINSRSSFALSQSDDSEFMMLCRFAYFHARLLDQQAKFLETKQQLEKLDNIHDRVHALDARPTQPGEAMGVLLDEIEGKLSEYSKSSETKQRQICF